MKIAIYPGSFDPITKGHLDVLKRAADIFDKVIIVVSVNVNKKSFLPLEDRLNRIKEACKDIPNIEVDSFDGLTIEYAKNEFSKIKAYLMNGNNDLAFELLEKVEDKTFSLTLEDRFIPDQEKPLFFINNTIEYTYDSNSDGIKLIQQTGTFKIVFKATNKTNNTQQNYGIKVDIANEYGQILKTFYFDTRSFIGQPFNCDQLTQSKIFYIEDETICPTQSSTESFNKVIDKIIITAFGIDSNIKIEECKLYTGSLIEVETYLRVNTTIDANKDYFAKELPGNNFIDSIKLKAELYNNSHKIVDSRTRYYWLVENDDVKNSTSEGFLNIQGAGVNWYCLNSFDYIDIVPDDNIATKIKVWKATSSSIEIDQTKKDLFKKYENKVKCIVKYGDNIVESKQFKIYNFAKESFSIEIENLSHTDLIITSKDVINLKATIFLNEEGEKRVFTNTDNKYIINYQWYIENYEETSKLNGYTTALINIQDKVNESLSTTVDIEGEEDPEAALVNYEIPNSTVNLLCKVAFKAYAYIKTTDTNPKKGVTYYTKDINGVFEAFTGSAFAQGIEYYIYALTTIYEEAVESPTRINSVIYTEAIITATTEYKYHLDTRSCLIFSKKYTDGADGAAWEWSPYENFTWVTENASYAGIFENFNYFTDTNLQTDNWYIYYTTRVVWTETKGNYSNRLRTEDWTYPILARQVGWNGREWVNLKIGPSIDKLNTFNQLTHGEKNDGVYYQESGDEIDTTKNTPNPNIKYYKKVNGTGDTINYVPIELIIETDEDGKQIAFWPAETPAKVYANIKDRLFINATYIQAGVLRVGDRFYADIT